MDSFNTFVALPMSLPGMLFMSTAGFMDEIPTATKEPAALPPPLPLLSLTIPDADEDNLNVNSSKLQPDSALEITEEEEQQLLTNTDDIILSSSSPPVSPNMLKLKRMLSKSPLDDNGIPLPSDQLTEIKDIKNYAKVARKERNKARLEHRRKELKEKRVAKK